jgi:hypothetical protein
LLELLLLLLLLVCLAGVCAALPCALLLLLLPLRNGRDASAATSVTGNDALRAAPIRWVLGPFDVLLLLLPLLVSLPLA